MSLEQVWYRFEVKKKDGSVWKLRIQDLPPARSNDALDLLMNFFVRDEPLHRAVGFSTNAKCMVMCKKVFKHNMSDPSFRTIICCSDDTPDVTNIMGMCMMKLAFSTSSIEQAAPQLSATVRNEKGRQETQKLHEILTEMKTSYNPFKELNLNDYYEGRALVVDPNYRGLGISKNFFKVRRLICKANGVPIAGGWTTGFGSQITAARDGWETVKEIEYDYLAKKYDVTFTDVPRTMKYMIAKTVQNEEVPQEFKKIGEMYTAITTSFDPIKEFNLDVYYEDINLVVDPDSRGLGISENFFKVRRLMCKAHGVPMTGAWMTAFGTQISAARDGWETVKEIEYDYLAKKYDVTFTEVPRTVKYMITRVDNTAVKKNNSI